MGVGPKAERIDPTYQDASYLGTDEEEDEEVRDLGFIVDDHDDRRIMLTGGFQRLDNLDTDEPLETNRSGKIPHETSLRERGASPEWFATDYHVGNARAEQQEEDFVRTSMLSSDPEMNDGAEDFTDDTLHNLHGNLASTDIAGHLPGVAQGLGSTLAQDLGTGGFQIRDNPLMQPEGQPISGELLSDEALGTREVDEMADDEELTAFADRVVREMEREGDQG
jgi:hypothetical protein